MKSFVLQWCFSRVISQLSNPRKMRVFSFIGLMWQIFKTLYISLSFPHSNLSQPKTNFQLYPIIFKLDFCKISLNVCFLNILFIFFLEYVEINLGFLNWGFFEKGVRNFVFGQIFSKFWLGCVPFVLCVSVLAPCGILIMY